MFGRLLKVCGGVARPHHLLHGGRTPLHVHRVLVGVTSIDPLDPDPERKRSHHGGQRQSDSDRSHPKQVLFGAGVGTLALADSDNNNDNDNNNDPNSDKACQFCGQGFSAPNIRKRHEDNMVCRKGRKRRCEDGPSQSEDGKFICCGTEYSSSNSLLNHQRYVSTFFLSDNVLRSALLSTLVCARSRYPHCSLCPTAVTGVVFRVSRNVLTHFSSLAPV